ncbi:MAG: type IIA DNA topoisomerase subunit B [Bacteroidales bacterium]|nr:type IIA DNA topoisomerase subunit B [Bacteroidales bacterium]
METNKGYGNEDIQHWDWQEHLRKRPGMYLGKLGDGSEKDDGIYVLFKEIVDNAIDEFNMGFGKTVDITLDEETKEVTVRDYGRGIPLESLVVSVGQINTSGKYGSDAYSKSGGLNGVGAKAVNATSTKFYAQSWRDGKSKWAYFEEGELKKEGELSNCREKDGTLIKYTADPTLYENYSYKKEYLDSMLKNYAYLNPGLTIHFNKTTYYSKNGLPDLINDNMTEPPLYSPIHLKGDDIEVVITHGRDRGENIYSFANGQSTYHGGTHLSAFREALSKTVKDFFKKDYDPKDVREGIVAAIAIKIGEPSFANQIKNYLNSSLTDLEDRGGIPIKTFIMNFLASELDNYLHKNPLIADAMQKKINTSEKERKEIADILKSKRRKRGMISNEKLRDCKIHYTDKNIPLAEKTTIFITEGNSASGTVSKARNADTQAVFSLRGKPMNTYGSSKKAIYDKENKELNLLQAALDIEEDIENLRYNRVVIATDADVDGMHIRMLMLTFFIKYHPELIRKGHLFILQTPLFRVRRKKKDNSFDIHYCYSETEKIKTVKELGKGSEITRFKGLGEISDKEFEKFIGDDMRLDAITLDSDISPHEMLEFFMGNNTPFRQDFIMKNLRTEVIMEEKVSDLTKERL